MLDNQGLSAVAFFEVTAFIILLVLFVLLRKDHPSRFLRIWVIGWTLLTLKAAFELTEISLTSPQFRLAQLLLLVVINLIFFESVLRYTRAVRSSLPMIWPASFCLLLAVYYFESRQFSGVLHIGWFTSGVIAGVNLAAGWSLWRFSRNSRGHGARLLAGLFLLSGLHGLDRPMWLQSPYFVLRLAFDHLLAVSIGIAMVVLVLEGARTRTDELNDKLRRLSLLTAASTQTLSVREMLDRVLANLVGSLGVSHGMVRLLEGEGSSARLVLHSAVGFDEKYIAEHKEIPANEPWVLRALKEEFASMKISENNGERQRDRMAVTGVKEIVTLILRVKFQDDEIDYLKNTANLLGLTLQNVLLFEQVDKVQRQWAYTFDSIGDPIFVHDAEGRILRVNQRMLHLAGRENRPATGRLIGELFPARSAAYQVCPYCEGVAGEGDDPDPWLPGYFLASNSVFADPIARQMGTVHVLKDISDRKRAEEKYRTLVSNVQEGVFISTPQGRFLDFNDAFLRIAGYATRERFLTELALDPPEASGAEAGAPLLDEDYLILSTIHSAKGQEWDVVFILNVADGCIPSDMATGSPQQIEEERRVLGVAMTRAKLHLHLIQPLRFFRSQQPRYGDAYMFAPRSRFIPDALLDLFERRAWPTELRESTKGPEGYPRTDIAARLRERWG